MFAVIKTGGKQFKVTKDCKITVEKIDAEEGKNIDIKDILLLNNGESTVIGSPLVTGAGVTAKVLEHKRADKIVVFKKKRRKNYRRKMGHKQHQTVLQIVDIKQVA